MNLVLLSMTSTVINKVWVQDSYATMQQIYVKLKRSFIGVPNSFNCLSRNYLANTIKY